VSKYGYIKIGFADALKESCKIMFCFTDEQLYGNLKEVVDERWGISPRIAMQYIGTDLFRKQIKIIMPWIDDNFWVECLKNKIKHVQEHNKTQNIVISDVRFENELDMIKNMGGTIICVKRDCMTLNDNHDTCNHESESYINTLPCDHHIKNNSTLNDLYDVVENITSML
jgi:hypothetical protein